MAFATQSDQPHPRRCIRHRIRDLLRQYVDVGGRVFMSRPDPLFLTELPCLLVYMSEEPADGKSSEPRYYTRKLQINVDILHSDRPNIVGDEDNELDDFLDSRAFEVEWALLHERYLGLVDKEWLHDVNLINTSAVEMIFDGEQAVHALRQTFEVLYETIALTDTTLDEFLRFQSKYRIASDVEETDLVQIRSS